ncbi:hypothetical protein RDI58_024309 [Solanum bulbocastanum]|uniref:Uncharacterized protein n=1 Tax=Solanum bulbocastanum TaxID=147425 RepID=A0AAN8T5L7_SOLBU
MVNEMVDDEPKSLGRCSVFTYGVGHMLNDITSSCWYTYLLLYLTDIGLSPSNAATVTLTGQFADAFTTLIAGELDNDSWLNVYCMSMVNGVTLNSTSRVACVSCRNAFTMIASLILYVIAFFVFNKETSRSQVDIKNQYQLMAYISIFIGAVFVIIFQLGTTEPSLKQESNGKRATASWTYWLKKVLYYQVLSIYVLTRVVTNVSQTFLAVYVINDLRMSPSSKALIPAIIYLSSFVASVLLQELQRSGERLKAWGSPLAILWSCSNFPPNKHAFFYVCLVHTYWHSKRVDDDISAFIASCCKVTAIGMESELVDKDLDGSAFVYGSLGFIDKVLCGVFLYFLESYEGADPVPCDPTYPCFSITLFSLGFIPGISALIGVVVAFFIRFHIPNPKTLREPFLA